MTAKVYPQPFPCPDESCSGFVSPEAKDGRFFLYKGVWINLPAHLLLNRCGKCGADWLNDRDDARIELVLQDLYLEHEELINEIFLRYQERTQRKP